MSEKVIGGNDWHDIVDRTIPERDEESYIYLRAKKETVAAVIFNADSQKMVMRVEGTLPSDFTPVPKIMSETIEGAETIDVALVRGVKEELGVDIRPDQFVFLGKLNGTYDSLHKFYLFFVVLDEFDTETDFFGDGSPSEDNSANIEIDPSNIVTEDWLWLTAYGLLKTKINSSDQGVLDLLTMAYGGMPPSEIELLL